MKRSLQKSCVVATTEISLTARGEQLVEMHTSAHLFRCIARSAGAPGEGSMGLTSWPMARYRFSLVRTNIPRSGSV